MVVGCVIQQTLLLFRKKIRRRRHRSRQQLSWPTTKITSTIQQELGPCIPNFSLSIITLLILFFCNFFFFNFFSNFFVIKKCPQMVHSLLSSAITITHNTLLIETYYDAPGHAPFFITFTCFIYQNWFLKIKSRNSQKLSSRPTHSNHNHNHYHTQKKSITYISTPRL